MQWSEDNTLKFPISPWIGKLILFNLFIKKGCKSLVTWCSKKKRVVFQPWFVGTNPSTSTFPSLKEEGTILWKGVTAPWSLARRLLRLQTLHITYSLSKRLSFRRLRFLTPHHAELSGCPPISGSSNGFESPLKKCISGTAKSHW